jgi:uncharacterized protein
MVLSIKHLNNEFQIPNNEFRLRNYELLLVADNVILQEPSYKWQLIEADPDDNKFADLAIGGNVDFLVTNDRHFEVLRKNKFPPVKVVSLEEFRKIVGY